MAYTEEMSTRVQKKVRRMRMPGKGARTGPRIRVKSRAMSKNRNLRKWERVSSGDCFAFKITMNRPVRITGKDQKPYFKTIYQIGGEGQY
ncbi:MAG: hypothetical protein JRJ51_24935 [Deltaproteobacteria bacterium]|nr:hypothetical protein [Deltaproteobacteria bacterium]